MTLFGKDKGQPLKKEIRRVLLQAWDPIGIKDEPNAQGEYDSYIGPIYELLVSEPGTMSLQRIC